MSFARTGCRLVVGSFLVLAMASAAAAHPGHGPHTPADGASGFAEGFFHPLLGLDHLLAMIAVGFCGVRLGGRALWLLPATFLASMVIGGGLALAGVPLPGVELGIVASVVVLGAMVAVSSVSLPAATLLVAFFALFHGFAHTAEMQSSLSATAYFAGFLAATAALHVGGVLAGVALTRRAPQIALRTTGGLIATAGLLLAVRALAM